MEKGWKLGAEVTKPATASQAQKAALDAAISRLVGFDFGPKAARNLSTGPGPDRVALEGQHWSPPGGR